MNAKLKIALLALLGFSTASCASKRAAKRSSDREMQKIEADTVDTRIMLMYGVPMPDGRPVMIVEEGSDEAAKYPDGAIAKPISEEEAKRRIEEMRAAEEADTLDLQISVMYGVPFPDGKVAHEVDESDVEAAKYPDGAIAKPISEEEAKKRIEEMRAAEGEE